MNIILVMLKIKLIYKKSWHLEEGNDKDGDKAGNDE